MAWKLPKWLGSWLNDLQAWVCNSYIPEGVESTSEISISAGELCTPRGRGNMARHRMTCKHVRITCMAVK